MKPAVRAFGALSDPGPARALNEDAYITSPELGVFAVADGFGGNGAGDLAAKTSLSDLRYFIEAGMRDSDVTLPFVYRSYYTAAGNLLFNAFLYANQKLYEANAQKHINGRGGASMLAAFFDGSHLTLANAGLCGAMLIRNGRMQTVLRPKSYNAVRGVYQGSWNARWAFPLASLGTAKDPSQSLWNSRWSGGIWWFWPRMESIRGLARKILPSVFHYLR
jgi:hypothetical protein